MKGKYLRKVAMDKDDFISLIVANSEVNESIGEMIIRLSKNRSNKVEAYTYRQPPIDFMKER